MTITHLPPIDRVFNRLAATYGAAWDRQMGQVPQADVKSVWMHELSGYLQNRNSMMPIAWALENLPERCPNVIEFRNLCRLAPATEAPKLPEPKATPERIAEEMEKLAPLRQMLATNPKVDPREWARRLIANPEMTTQATLRMAKDALGVE